VPEGIKIPSSFGNVFKELKQDLGCSIPSHGNLVRVYLPWPFQWGKPTVNQREATPIVFAELVALVEDLSAATLQKILADTRFKSLQARSKWFNDAVVIIFTSAPVVAVAVFDSKFQVFM
uniref:Uncharacterized protein n=1 Tax=Chenopodium quinoa TaxID=63459 RepID=A0A803KUU2_CHEQI